MQQDDLYEALKNGEIAVRSLHLNLVFYCIELHKPGMYLLSNQLLKWPFIACYK